jgi:hypothetical protein
MKALVTRPIATTPVRPGAAPPARATSGGQGSGPAMPVRPTGQMGARQPTAQQPGAAKPKVPPKPPKSTKEREFRPGDLYCGNCGEGNEPNRRFCRKCGASLANAPVVATPWYKRLKRKKKVLAAGERAKGKDGQRQAYGMHPGRDKVRRIFKALMIIAVVVLMIALLTPWGGGLRRRLTSAKDSIKAAIIPTYEPIHPTSAQASSALPDHPATLAIDGTSNMAWEPSAPGDGVGQQLVLTFDHQQNIDRIGFLSGVSDKQDEFLAQPRPRQLHLVFSNGTSKDITLKDTPTFQQFSIKAHAVVSVQITVVSVNTSFNGGHTMGIAEVELFRRK